MLFRSAEWRAAARGQFFISGIKAKDIPDADKKGGSGTTDPCALNHHISLTLRLSQVYMHMRSALAKAAH